MKIKELIEILNQCNPESEINVLFPLPNRPIGGTLESIFEIKPCIDQDSNKTHYAIDTGIGEEARYEAHINKTTDNNSKDMKGVIICCSRKVILSCC